MRKGRILKKKEGREGKRDEREKQDVKVKDKRKGRRKEGRKRK